MEKDRELLARVENLESKYRRMKVVGCLLSMAFLIAQLAELKPKNKIEVTELAVKDASGVVVARLGTFAHGACLKLAAHSGSSTADLCVDNFYGSTLDLFNQNPKSSAVLSAGRKLYEGGGNLVPGVFIDGPGGENKFYVNVGSEARLLIGHVEQNGSVVVSAGSGSPKIEIVGNRGERLWTSP